MKIISDKYFLMCAAVAFIIITSSFCLPDETDSGHVGLVRNVKTSENGFVFTFEESDGSVYRCFSKTEPSVGSLCEIKGSFSGDGTMFFASSISSL